jgi:hypothetical protein
MIGARAPLAIVFSLLLGCSERAHDAERAALPLPDSTHAVAAAPARALETVPWSQRVGLEQAVAERDARFLPRADEAGFVLGVPDGVATRVTAAGASIELGATRASLALASVGRGDQAIPCASTAPEVESARVVIDRTGGAREWWRALPSGLEHGFDLAERPAGVGALVLRIAVRGVTAITEDDAIVLRDGERRLATYAHLVVLDAAGGTVPSHMTADGTSIAIAVDDAAARYPLSIDPLLAATQEAELRASDAASNNFFGISVALDSMATRALIGAIGHASNAGAAYVLVRNGTSWTQEAELTASDAASNNYFGSVALDSTGTRALVGAYGHSSQTGAAYVFVRNGSVWTQEAELTALDGVSGNTFGYSVALDSTGLRALVGANGRLTSAGAAYVFLRSGSTWTQEAEIIASDTAMNNGFGATVAFDSMAMRALIGASARNSNTGAAYVFARSGTTWTQEAELTAADAAASNLFGYSIALDGTATRALIGAEGRAANTGAAYVFTRSGTTWTQEAELTASDAATGNNFGGGVALDSTAMYALVGAFRRASDVGAAYVFQRSGTTWTQGAELTATDGVAGDQFGRAVALDGTAARVLMGAPIRAANTGAAYVFTIVAASANGAACTSGASCLSGICVDGVCCNTACGGGYSATGTNCSSCLASNTGGTDGVCAALSASVAATVTCRAASGPCDTAELCTSSGTSCPADAFMAATAVCQTGTATGNPCLADAHCSGTSGVCPANPPGNAGAACRAASGACDVGATCTGTSATCPPNAFVGAGTICHTAVSPCDTNAVCSGASAVCPPASPAAAGTTCRAANGACDVAETCDGSTTACPGDAFLTVSSICHTAMATDLCDSTVHCTGASATCPPSLMAAGTVCHTAAGVCDTTTMCSGTSATCPSSFVSGLVCRHASGTCDVAESCSGTSANCPADGVLASGVVCRMSTGTCDPAESCDGTSTACPADVSTCTAMPDASTHDGGTDAGSDAGRDAAASDATAATIDSGGPPAPVAGGCACRAQPRHAGVFGWSALAIALVVVRRAGRSRPRLTRRA